MSKKDEAIRAALEALERISKAKPDQLDHAIDVAIVQRCAKVAFDALSLLRSAMEEGEEPVAWMWQYIGRDPIGNQIKPCARSLHEMDPRSPPYPDTWKPLYPLFASPIAADTKDKQ